MSDVNRVITLGVGPIATIDGFILVGLNTTIAFTGVLNTKVRRGLTGTDATRAIRMTVKRDLGAVRVEFDD